MAIDHIEFLNFAKSLPSHDEINLRNAISRAYYAAFHACDLNFQASPTENGGMHAKLINTLQHSNDARTRSIGRMLNQLKGQRVRADYHLHFDVKNNDRVTSVLHAEQLIKKVDEIISAPSLAQKQS